MGLKAVTTPDRDTIQFHLAKPFADFNYVVAIPQTAPVPPNKDTGANTSCTHPPARHVPELPDQQAADAGAEPHWNPATNPQVKQLPSKIIRPERQRQRHRQPADGR
jgi:peptide/nickel transport system substrate-binding protein